jgi:hypothetical protein
MFFTDPVVIEKDPLAGSKSSDELFAVLFQFSHGAGQDILPDNFLQFLPVLYSVPPGVCQVPQYGNLNMELT